MSAVSTATDTDTDAENDTGNDAGNDAGNETGATAEAGKGAEAVADGPGGATRTAEAGDRSPGVLPNASEGSEAAAPAAEHQLPAQTAPADPAAPPGVRRREDLGFDDGLIARRAGPAGPAGAATQERVPHPYPRGGIATVATGGGSLGDEGGSLLTGGGSALGTGSGGGSTGRSGTAEPEAVAFREGPLRERLDALRELVGLSRARLDDDTLAEAGRVLEEAAARRRLSGRHTVVALAGATGSGKSTLFNTLAGVNISDTGVRRPTTSAPFACSWTDGAAGLLDRLGVPGRLRRRPVQGPEGEGELSGLVLIDLPDHDSAAFEHREQVDRILGLVDAVIWVVDPEKYADAVLHERYLRPMAGHAEVSFVVLNQIDRLPGEAADLVLDDLRRLLDEDGIPLGEHGEPGATVLSISALTGDGVGELRDLLGTFVGERRAAAQRVCADLDLVAARLRPVYAAGQRIGLSEQARAEFADRLAEAVGAAAAGDAAERAWRRNASRACGTPWLRLWRWYEDRRAPESTPPAPETPPEPEATARQRVEQAVRTVGEEAALGLPAPWAVAVREAAARGAKGLPEALDALVEQAGGPVARSGTGARLGSTGRHGRFGDLAGGGEHVERAGHVGTAGRGERAGRVVEGAGRPPRPGWWPVAVLTQAAMTVLQLVGALWLMGQIVGVLDPNLGVPVLLMAAGIVGGPCVEWSCRIAARGPARRYGLDAERRLREAAAGCGRARVLDPVAAELLRYEEVREQFVRVVGDGPVAGTGAGMGAGLGRTAARLVGS